MQFQIRKVSEKVMSWKVAARKLQRDLPPNDDVLSSLINTIEEFGQNIPFLQDLCSVSLKVEIYFLCRLLFMPMLVLWRHFFSTFSVLVYLPCVAVVVNY